MNKIISKIYLFLLVFISGASVAAIEITAARLLAPFFGSSIFVWANIIGVVMIALAFGYYLGGKIADKKPYLRILLYIIFGAGFISSFIPLIFKGLSFFIVQILTSIDIQYSVILGSFFVSISLFIMPLVLLGMVSPFAVRLATESVETTGQKAGSLYSFSTIGSIFGIFLAAFVSVPYLGSSETILMASFLLMAVAALGIKKRFWLLILLLLPIIFYFFIKDFRIKHVDGLVYEKESVYQFIQIIEDDEEYTLRINDGWGIQSVYNSGDVLTGMYFDYFNLLPYLQEDKQSKDVLIVGLAGGTISRQYHHFFENKYDLKIDGVEIDGEIIKAAQRYFDIDESGVNIYQEDGRTFLKRQESKYDIIIVDAYAQQLYIPSHLSTKEFFTEVKDHLNEGGILALNLLSSSQENDLTKRLTATIRSVFPNTYITPVTDDWNFLIIGSHSPFELEGLPSRVKEISLKGLAREVEDNLFQIETYKDDDIFTDNHNPVELLTEISYFQFLISNDNSIKEIWGI